ncbi:hypothetical protein ACEW7V_01705 [Areca yellow leaf disease phytoplasma]
MQTSDPDVYACGDCVNVYYNLYPRSKIHAFSN